MADLHRLGHDLSYTETKFIEDKWVQWSEKQSKLVPENIRTIVLLLIMLIILPCWYNFDRKFYRSYKGLGSTLNPVNFMRVECKI